MKHLYNKGHPPWYARGTPVVKLRDGPARIRGRPRFAICEGPGFRGNPYPKLLVGFKKNTLFFSRQNNLFSQWSDLSACAASDNVEIGSVNFYITLTGLRTQSGWEKKINLSTFAELDNVKFGK